MRAAGGDKFLCQLGADIFGDADEHNFVGVTAGGFGGGRNAFADTLKILGDAHPFILYGARSRSRVFDFDPFLVFAGVEEWAGREFAGDVLAEHAAIAAWA
jgi:hypothetical protein